MMNECRIPISVKSKLLKRQTKGPKRLDLIENHLMRQFLIYLSTVTLAFLHQQIKKISFLKRLLNKFKQSESEENQLQANARYTIRTFEPAVSFSNENKPS